MKESYLHAASVRLDQGMEIAAEVETVLAIRHVGGLVSPSGLKLTLTEMCSDTVVGSPRLRRVAPGTYAAAGYGPDASVT